MPDNNSLRDQFGSREKSSAQSSGDAGDLGGAFGSRSAADDQPQQPAAVPAQPERPVSSAPASPPLTAQAPADDQAPKKRYYAPNEVMAKKGCIGCGGMALAIPLLLGVVGLAARLR
jgi:hypothetical protein